MNINRREPIDAGALVFPLAKFSRDDLDRAGGKGANLGELIRAGLPVPPGFVITTDAYAALLQNADLRTRLREALDTLNADDPTSVRRVGESMRNTLVTNPVPPPIAQAVRAAYRELGEGPVAVRSSATAEDLPQAAFAGQQDTILNIVGEMALLDAVRRCWASLWSERAIAYRARQQIDQATVKLAVVVQRMIPAETAGVMFTANPVTGARDELIIDASPGLGEAVVSGMVTPDHLIVDKRSLRIKEQSLGRRETVIRALPEGGTEQVGSGNGAPANAPALSTTQVRALARLGLVIEQHYHSPQDIEWAWAHDEPFILQARPITALPLPAPRPSKPQQFMASLFGEMMPERPYPADLTTWAPALYGAIEEIFGLLGLRGIPFEQLFVVEDGVAIGLGGSFPYRPTFAILLAPFRLLWMVVRYNPVRWQSDPLLADVQSRTHILATRNLTTLSWQGLLETMHEALAIPLPLAGEIRRRYIPRAALAAGLLRLLLALVRRGRLFAALLSGVDNQTLETNRALEHLADDIRSNSTLAGIMAHHPASELWATLDQEPSGKQFLSALWAFLDRYGHREAAALMVSLATWKDAPEVVLGILQGLAATRPRQESGRPAWENARDEVLGQPLVRLPFVRSIFLELLAEARCLIQIREDTHLFATAAMPIVRRTLLEFGGRLTSIGVLGTPEDVFHLRLDDLEQVDGTWPPPLELAGSLRAAVRRRKERRAALQGTPVIDPRLYRQSPLEGNVLLRGSPGSPGIAEGPVRIIHDGSEFGRLRAGDVLVAPFTNPAWTPLFQRAAAVVVDSGSAVSHAAIVAREYGIPAVMGTREGTQKLRDDSRVRVDGSRGLVSEPEDPE
ncbi:MAG: PEP/pyruvate-binding domain-containing protein [Acidobacteriota bacterium]